MKIGVGVITAGKRPIRDYRCAPDTQFRVFHDASLSGPGHMRNECLKHFYDAGCDFIFCFDDDVYPVMDGWEHYFIEQSKQSGVAFFALPHSFVSRLEQLIPGSEIGLWRGHLLTQFAMYSREVIEKVGYYDLRLGRYGYEDDLYIRRCCWAGLTGSDDDWLLPSPVKVLGYIYSEDVHGTTQIQNMTAEEKKPHIEFAVPVWEQLRKERQAYVGFSQ